MTQKPAKKKTIIEGKAKIYAYISEKVSKKLPVFYNPVMAVNRDISVLLVNAVGRKNIRAALPLAASGIRGIRLLLETKKGIIKELLMNDISPEAVNLINKNISLIDKELKKRTIVKNKDANIFLLENRYFDYIDIDPFGSPNGFVDSAVKSIAKEGIIAITATDTSALCGTYPKACRRKYFAVPLRNELMHEIGIRILIRKIQLIAAQYDKALRPILSYSKDHYFRAFLKAEKGKKKVDGILKQHKYLLYCNKCMHRKISDNNNEKCEFCNSTMQYAGPLWSGKLNEKTILEKILENTNKSTNTSLSADSSIKKETIKLVGQLYNESGEMVGFYDIHKIVKKYKVRMPKTEALLEKTREIDKLATHTHFSSTGIKTGLTIKEIIKIIKTTTN